MRKHKKAMEKAKLQELSADVLGAVTGGVQNNPLYTPMAAAMNNPLYGN
jgi:hypothetical protein